MLPEMLELCVMGCLYAYSAVCPQDGALFSLILPQANAATAEIFFNEFSKAHASYRVVMVMDQASWHPREGDERWDNIRFIHQPAHGALSSTQPSTSGST
jgi:transposase-like protein